MLLAPSASPCTCRPAPHVVTARRHRRRHVAFHARGSPSQNGATPPFEEELEQSWERGGLPEYMQGQGECETWEETLRRGEEKRTGAALQGPGDVIWSTIRREAEKDAAAEPLLSSFLYASILSHDNFERSLAFVLSNRLSDATFLSTELFEVFYSILRTKPDIAEAALADLRAVRERDPACLSYSQALLHFKGFHAIQAHRIAHELWSRGRKVMACALQSRMSEVFAVDIHPAASFGKGILLDHGTGVVIGETAELGNNVSILQNVTLGGTGKVHGDRHPKISDNVLIGASASILGNIRVGKGAQVAAGSLVLKPVPPRTLVAGSPAKEIGKVEGNPALNMEAWNVCKETLKAQLENDPLAVAAPSPRPKASRSSSSAGAAAGSAAQQEQSSSSASAAAAAAAPDGQQDDVHAAEPVRPSPPSEAAILAAQQGQQAQQAARNGSPGDGDGSGEAGGDGKRAKRTRQPASLPPEYSI